MHTHISKWGASCAIRLPKMAVETLGLYEGQAVSLVIEGDRLVLRRDFPKYKLEQLVSQMDSLNEPPLMLDDSPQGEEWL